MTPFQATFISVINLSIAASFLMLAVILLRPFLKRVPKWLVCALWALVAVRLAVPFSLESKWSLVPAWKIAISHSEEEQAGNNGSQTGIPGAEDWQGESVLKNLSEDNDAERAREISVEKGLENPSEANDWQGLSHENVGENVPHTEGSMSDGGASKQNDHGNTATYETKEHGSENISSNETSAVTERQADGRSEVTPAKVGKDESVISVGEGTIATDESIFRETFEGVQLMIGSGIWLAGIIAMLAYGAISFMRLRSRLKTAVRLEEGAGAKVWISDAITEPFVLGIIRPRIYLPSRLEAADLDCVLCHERAHVRRGDYLWKPLGFLILCVYWFHPLCWISYLLFCRDVEMACDEKATKDFDVQERKRYCQALLNFSQGKKTLIGTVAFGENGTKSRVKAILNYKKPSFWVILAGVFAGLAVGFFFMTSPNGNSTGSGLAFPTKIQRSDVVPEGKQSNETFVPAATDATSVTDAAEDADKTNLDRVEVQDNVTLFQAVLRGERDFYVAAGEEEIIGTNIADVSGLFDSSNPYLKIYSFAIADLDHDGEEEVILFVISAGAEGRVILRRWGNAVYAYVVDYRSMWELKTDGSYEYNTGNFNDGFARITGFTSTSFMEDRYTYETGPFDGADTFVVGHASVSENEYKKAVILEHGKKKAVWHDFNEESIASLSEDFQHRVSLTDPQVLKSQILREISQMEFAFPAFACTGGQLVINEDGSFSGGYTNRYEAPYHYYESRFTGSLEITRIVDAYTCQIKVTELCCEKEPGTKWKDGEFFYEEILPPGMEEGGEYLLCLPGKSVEELPRGILYQYGTEIERAGAWTVYGIGAIPKTREEAFTDLKQWKYYDLIEYGEDLALCCRNRYPSLMKEWSVKALSPDRSRYLYGKSENQDGKTILTVGVIDAHEYHRPTEFRLNTENGNDIIKVYWLSDTLVGAETHVNPSTGEFFIYDLETGKEVKHYVGSSFAVIPGTSHVMYEENVPHFSDEDLCHSFYIDDQKVYTSDWLNARLGKPLFSDDLTWLKFTEQRYDLDVSREVTCDFDLRTMTLSNPRNSGKSTGESSDELSIRLPGKEAWEAEGIGIRDFYARDDGDVQNAYVIDEEGILWGYGENRYGQLGQGFADRKFYKEKVKVAENVIHVDYSETGFVIYLTEDHKLYGLGNDGSGVLLTGENTDWNSYVKGEEHAVCLPVLLMERVRYACCGRNDVVCLLEDGSVWTWGITGISTARVYDFTSEPVKILDEAMLVTGGLFNHAALLEDGSVWTWGYNYAGGCGVPEFGIVDTPTKVAEHVIKVWTCKKRTNTCADYENMSPINEKQMENTIIEKLDHSFFSCGEGVGNEERILKKYYEAVDFPMICTHEFLPCAPMNP